MQLSKRLSNFPEYIFSKLNREILRIEKQSKKKVLNLGIGTPTFPTSRKYINKLQEYFAEEDAHLYPGYGPKPFFTEALLNWYKKRFQVELAENEIFPLLGAKDGVSHINLALLDAGDEVVVPDPGYPAYQGAAQMVDANPVAYELSEENDFQLDVKAIDKKSHLKPNLSG
jgi:aspartate/methionine/tyrosine aminotransferase